MEDLHGESQKCLPLRLPTEGEGGLEYLSPWKTFFCLVWMPRPLQAGQCSAPTLWLSDPWLGARVSDHGGDNETPQNQTNFQSPISPRFRNPPFFQSHSTWSRRILLPKGWNHDDQSTIQFIEAMTFLFEIVLIFHICPQITGATFILGWSCWLLQNSLFCESWPCLLLAWLIVVCPKHGWCVPAASK